jgi:hypothetical protein
MNVPRIVISSLAGAVLACMVPAIADAAPRYACSILTLTTVRAIVAAPVTVYHPGSTQPTVQGDLTSSTCTYTINAMGKGARVMMLWGPSATLIKMYQFYVKRNREMPQIKGDVLILGSVTNTSGDGVTYDLPASKRLLAAAVQQY